MAMVLLTFRQLAYATPELPQHQLHDAMLLLQHQAMLLAYAVAHRVCRELKHHDGTGNTM